MFSGTSEMMERRVVSGNENTSHGKMLGVQVVLLHPVVYLTFIYLFTCLNFLNVFIQSNLPWSSAHSWNFHLSSSDYMLLLPFHGVYCCH